MYDIAIRNGTLVDGTGADARRADVGIRGDRIVEVGTLSESARREIDATDRLVTPGFIDTHTHLDAQLFWDPYASPVCWHGVTTALIGNCSVTYAPVRPEQRDALSRTLESVEQISVESVNASLPFNWESFSEYLRAIDNTPKGINVAGFMGHAAARVYVLGDDAIDPDRHPDAGELKQMQALLTDALSAGALGVSTSRTYTHTAPDGRPIPGTYAREPELRALGEVLGREGGIFQWASRFGERDEPGLPHTREELKWLSDISLDFNIPVVFSLFTGTAPGADYHRQILKWTDEHRARGANIRPMQNSRVGTNFFGAMNFMMGRNPAWQKFNQTPPEQRIALLADEAYRRSLTDVDPEMEQAFGQRFWTFSEDNLDYKRRDEDLIASIAARHGERPMETVVRLMLGSDGRQMFATGSNNGQYDNVREILAYPHTIPGLGDSGAHVKVMTDANLTTYLMSHWVRDTGLLTLENGVHRLTAGAADFFGLTDRGRIQPGCFADVNVIDYENLTSLMPEYVDDYPCHSGRWTQKAKGYDYTLCNGRVMIEDDKHTGSIAGRLLAYQG
ncbi:MAG: amidohydrolase family protein [Proteobacteria bacterium]|nr:amidohydrolase family protein [Pseudomonadota bacterium]